MCRVRWPQHSEAQWPMSLLVLPRHHPSSSTLAPSLSPWSADNIRRTQSCFRTVLQIETVVLLVWNMACRRKAIFTSLHVAAMMCVSFDLCLFSGEMKREIEKVRKYKYYIRGLQAAPGPASRWRIYTRNVCTWVSFQWMVAGAKLIDMEDKWTV